MAGAVSSEDVARFEQLFTRPTVSGMLALTWQDFERFVAHVFTCAGYTVEHVSRQTYPLGPGVDLNLYAGPIKGKPLVRVEVRRYTPGNPIMYHDVTDFAGVLAVAHGIPGYLVTTSTFHENAVSAAAAVSDKVRLIDGHTLVRYITYIGGSRLSGEYAGVAVAPLKPTSPAWLETADAVAKGTTRPPRTTRVLAIANPKGGVAKTTTALNIAFALADQHKQRVLLVDMDGQASLTHSLPRPLPQGAPKDAPPMPDLYALAAYFRGQSTLAELARPTRFANLSLVPAQRDLYRLQFGGADRAKAELRFVEDVRNLVPDKEDGTPGEPFQWIVLDTPAGDSFYARAALAAADYIVIPALAETYAVQGIGEMLTMAKTMGALMGDPNTWKDRVLGCIITRWRPGTNADAALATIKLALSNDSIRIFGKAIPVDDRVETAHRGTGGGGIRSIFHLTKTMGPAATAYDGVVEEMIADVNRRESKDKRSKP